MESKPKCTKEHNNNLNYFSSCYIFYSIRIIRRTANLTEDPKYDKTTKKYYTDLVDNSYLHIINHVKVLNERINELLEETKLGS